MDMTSTRCDEPSALQTAAMSRQFLEWKRAPPGRHGLFPFRKRKEKFARKCDNEHNALGVVRQVDLERKQRDDQQQGRIGDVRKQVEQRRARAFQPQDVQHPADEQGEPGGKEPESREREGSIERWRQGALSFNSFGCLLSRLDNFLVTGENPAVAGLASTESRLGRMRYWTDPQTFESAKTLACATDSGVSAGSHVAEEFQMSEPTIAALLEEMLQLRRCLDRLHYEVIHGKMASARTAKRTRSVGQASALARGRLFTGASGRGCDAQLNRRSCQDSAGHGSNAR